MNNPSGNGGGRSPVPAKPASSKAGGSATSAKPALTKAEDIDEPAIGSGSDIDESAQDPARNGVAADESELATKSNKTWDLTPSPYESPGRSLQRHWRLAALVMVLTTLLAFAAAVVKTPTYSAESRLIVGKTVQINNVAATPGLSVAGTELAATYSRLLSTPAVLADAQKRAGAVGAGGSVSASPIPLSPIIRVEGTGTSAEMAAAQANAGAKALVKAVNDVNAAQKLLSDDLLKQYETVDSALIKDKSDLQGLQQQLQNNPANTLVQDQVVAAQTKVDRDTLTLNNIATQYQASASPQQVNEQIVQRLGTATDAGNDRKSFLAMALIAGLVLGALIALGLAVLLDKRAGERTPHESAPALHAGTE